MVSPEEILSGLKPKVIVIVSIEESMLQTRSKEPVQAPKKTSLSFRLAKDDADLPVIVELARDAHNESRFGYIPSQREKQATYRDRTLSHYHLD